jgi:hypothetical protein
MINIKGCHKTMNVDIIDKVTFQPLLVQWVQQKALSAFCDPPTF